MRQSANSAKIAVCGILTALSLVALILAGFLGVMTYAAPMLVGGIMIVPVKEYGAKTAITMFTAVSLLGIMLVTDKELAFFYLMLFGHYPILQPYINRLSSTAVRILIKAAIFNGCSVLAIWLASVVMAVPVFNTDNPIWMVLLFYFVVGNFSFIFYDHALWEFFALYDAKLRVFLRKFVKF